MATKSAQKTHPARTRKPTPARGKFNLDAHKATIIVSLLTLVGILATSAINNLDTLRGNQTTQVAAPDTTGDLLAYNEQRRGLVEGAFDQALSNLQEAEKKAAEPDAQTVRDFAASVRENKATVQNRYDKVLAAIKDKKPVQADINKTELNTMIVKTQREYDAFRLTFELQTTTSGAIIVPENSVRPEDRRLYASEFGIGIAFTESGRINIQKIPSMTFPIGQERNDPLQSITPLYRVVAHMMCKSCEKRQTVNEAEY